MIRSILLALSFAAQPAPPDGDLVSQTHGSQLLFAPDQAGLDRLETGLAQANAHFETYIGVEPPAIALAYISEPADRETYSREALGLPVYHFQALPGSGGIVAWDAAGLVAAPGADGPPQVMGVYEDGPADVAGLMAGDALIGVDGEEISSMDEFNAVRRAAAGGETAKFTVMRGGERLEADLVYASDPQAVTQRMLMQAFANQPLTPPSTDTISHEAIHTMLGAHFDQTANWFHEGFASMSEAAQSRARNRQALRRNLAALIPWRDLFPMENPASSFLARNAPSQALEEAADGGHAVVAQSGGVRLDEGSAAGVSVNGVSLPEGATVSGGVVAIPLNVEGGGASAGLYYPESMSILEYIEAQAGPAAVGALAEWIDAGKEETEFPLPMEDDPDATLIDHEDAWRAWAASQGE